MNLSPAISLTNLLCICICVQRCVHGCSWSFVYNNKGLKTTQRSIIRGLAAFAIAKSLQSCPTLCGPIDGSPPGSPVPGILQARTLEWVAISFSNAWKWKGKVKSLSRVWLLATPWTAAHQAPPSLGFSRQEYWSGVPLPSPIRGLIYSIVTFHSMKQHVHVFKKRVLNVIIQNIIAKIHLKNKKVKVQKSVYRMLTLFPNIRFVHPMCSSVLKGSPLCHQMCESLILQSDCKL